MGINLCEANAILSLRRSGAAGDDIVCLGRPELFMSPRQVADLAKSFGHDWSASALEAIAASRHAEPLLAAVGFNSIRSLDASDYEGAAIVHDLNTPLPEHLAGSSGFVYDGGTIEHVFDVATALANTTALLRVGGTLLISAAANNQCGHGFYQYSPELFYRYLEANGFSEIRVYLVGLLTPNRWRRAADPKTLGRRVQFLTAEPTQMLVMARKVANVAPAVMPQQSDYAGLNWRKSELELASEHGARTSLAGHARAIAKTRILLPVMAAVRSAGGPGFPGLLRTRDFAPVDPVRAML